MLHIAYKRAEVFARMTLSGLGCRLQTCSCLATEWFNSTFRASLPLTFSPCRYPHLPVFPLLFSPAIPAIPVLLVPSSPKRLRCGLSQVPSSSLGLTFCICSMMESKWAGLSKGPAPSRTRNSQSLLLSLLCHAPKANLGELSSKIPDERSKWIHERPSRVI